MQWPCPSSHSGRSCPRYRGRRQSLDRLLWERPDSAGIDFAQNVCVLARSSLRTEKKVGVPDGGELLLTDPERFLHLGHPLVFGLRPEGLVCSGRRILHDVLSGCRRYGHVLLEKCSRPLVAETHDLAVHEIAPDHAVTQALDVGLGDQRPRPREVFAARRIQWGNGTSQRLYPSSGGGCGTGPLSYRSSRSRLDGPIPRCREQRSRGAGRQRRLYSLHRGLG
jgi:hypothetical protein